MVLEAKADEIDACLSSPNVDLWRLREFALTDGGFINNSLRKRAWPKLLGIDRTDIAIVKPNLSEYKPDGTGNPSDLEAEQIDRDVIRSSWHLTSQFRRNYSEPGSPKTEDDLLLEARQSNLANLIKIVLRDAGNLCYYQGYHDIAAVFLSVLNENKKKTNSSKSKNSKKTVDKKLEGNTDLGLASSLLLKISKSHLRDAMQSDFSSISAVLKIVMFPMIQFFDSKLHQRFMESGIEPYFALSWLLTWFSHDVRDTKIAARLFDAFLASHPLFPLYLSVAMVLHPVNRQLLMETENDFSAMHVALQSLPKNSCKVGWRKGIDYDFDEDIYDGTDEQQNFTMKQTIPTISFQDLIERAISLMRHLPPRNLISLATNYEKGILKEHLKNSSQIQLLKKPPSWALQSSAPSDLVLSQRRSDSNVKGNFRTKTAKVRRRKKKGSIQMPEDEENENSSNIRISEGTDVDTKHESILINDNRDAVIASGMGPDASDNTKIKLLILGGIVCVVISIGWAWAKAYKRKDSKFTYLSILGPAFGIRPSTCAAIYPNASLTADQVNRYAYKKNWFRTIFSFTKSMLENECEIVIL